MCRVLMLWGGENETKSMFLVVMYWEVGNGTKSMFQFLIFWKGNSETKSTFHVLISMFPSPGFSFRLNHGPLLAKHNLCCLSGCGGRDWRSGAVDSSNCWVPLSPAARQAERIISNADRLLVGRSRFNWCPCCLSCLSCSLRTVQ